MKSIILVSLTAMLLTSSADANLALATNNLITSVKNNQEIADRQSLNQFLLEQNQFLLEQFAKGKSENDTGESNSTNSRDIPSYYVDSNSRIEIRESWSRYCIEGIQYLSSDEHYRTFTTLVDKEGKPLQCIAVFKASK